MISWLLALAARMVVTASVVVAASLAAERAGSFVGAMIATVPVSAGPALVFLALDHGPAFVARSAVTGLLSVAATAVFVAGYVLVAARSRTAPALLAAYGGWALALALASLRDWTVGEAFGLAIGVTAAAILGTRRAKAVADRRSLPARPWHIAARAGAVALLVLGVTLAGRALGPEAAGYAALVPIVFTSMILILHPRVGGAATAATLAHGLSGMLGYAPALALLNLLAVPFGSAVALGAALAVCVGWNGALVLAARRTISRP